MCKSVPEEVLHRGGIATREGRAAGVAFDRHFRGDGNKLNPGTTADLITACLFVALRENRVTPSPRFRWSFPIGCEQCPPSVSKFASRKIIWCSAAGTLSATAATSASGCTATTTRGGRGRRQHSKKITTSSISSRLKKRTKEITDELDHHMLLATRNPVIAVNDAMKCVRVQYEDREWMFPRGDCILLPIENTTAELLARYIAGRLWESLRTQENFTPEVLRVKWKKPRGNPRLLEWAR